MAFAVRRLALAMLKTPVDAECLGVRFRLHPGDNLCEKRILFTPQFFDQAELFALLHDVQSSRDPAYVFIDIGANVGIYSLVVASADSLRVTAFAVEPQPVVRERLNENILLNPRCNVRSVPWAIADFDGVSTLLIAGENRGTSRLQSRSADGEAPWMVEVPVHTLLSLAKDAGIDRIDSLKIDVEGTEDRILSKFFETAPTSLWPRLLILESSREDWSIDLLDLLYSCGYELKKETRMNYILSLAEPAVRPAKKS